ncbi:MAG: hypothetical protein ACKPKO_39350, partial [Candidatus Fonsibacter sp.]
MPKQKRFKEVSARAKLDAVVSWASAEKSSCSDMNAGPLYYFGQRRRGTYNYDGNAIIANTKYIDQQSVLLAWNGPWANFM